MTRPTCSVCGANINTEGQTRCWKHRGGPVKPARVKPRRDPVIEDVAAVVRARDGACCAARARFPVSAGPCKGPTELDHVDTGGIGLRGPSTTDNLAALCQRHHRWKTEHGATARPLLRSWISSWTKGLTQRGDDA